MDCGAGGGVGADNAPEIEGIGVFSRKVLSFIALSPPRLKPIFTFVGVDSRAMSLYLSMRNATSNAIMICKHSETIRLIFKGLFDIVIIP